MSAEIALFPLSQIVLPGGRMPLRIFEDFSYLGYIGVLILLIAVELLGFVGGGSQRWLNLGFMNLQPSELMKVAIVLALARFYAQLPPGNTRTFTALWPALLAIGFPAALVMLQPDLGTALAICIGGVVVMFVSGLPFWWFGSAAAAGAAALPVLFSMLHDYQQKRVLIFLDPESDPLGAGYHISQSKIAIGSGGLTGKGWREGSQAHLNFIPEQTTDFVFAVLSEEFGWVGVATVLALYLFVVGRCLWIAMEARDTYSRLLAGSLGLAFFVYVLVNGGMVSGLLPVVGVPMPLLSYGGTSAVSLLAGLGLVMAVRTHKPVHGYR